LVVYLLTLSRDAYPGSPAALMAAVARLIPEQVAAHPIWMLLARGLTHVPLLDLPVRLNLLSAVCGAMAVALFGMLVARLIAAATREESTGRESAMAPEADDHAAPAVAQSAGNEPVTEQNRHAARAALFGGVVAAAALAFCVPFWSASTRLQYQAFDALLLLVVLHLAGAYVRSYRTSLLLLTALLCGFGCVEAASFVPVTAVLLALLPLVLVRRGQTWERRLLSAIAMAALGAALALLVLFNLRRGNPLAAPTGLRVLVSELLHSHVSTLRGSLPHSGWIWYLLAFVPAGVLSLSAATMFLRRSSFLRSVVNLLLTITTLLCLFNAEFSPWGIAREIGYLPIFAYLCISLAAGYLTAYWLLFATPADQEEASPVTELTIPLRVRRWIGGIVAGSLAAMVLCAVPLFNLHEADGRRGAFADQAAREVLAVLGSRDWIISSQPIDVHLQLAAYAQGRTLHVLPPGDANDAHRRLVRRWIESEPLFAAHRDSLRLAANLGVPSFVDAWLKMDDSAGARLATLGLPAVWKRAGWQAVPCGLGYGGARRQPDLGVANLQQAHRNFWRRMEIVLAPSADLTPPLERLRLRLRQQIGRTANDLGVLLQDCKREADAREAYETARRFDPANLSALINLYLLAGQQHRDEEQRVLDQELHARIGSAMPPISRIVDVCGDIRQSTIFVNAGRSWSLRGQDTVAKSELDRALELAPDSTAARMQLATLYLKRGDTNSSERIYRAMLGNGTTNFAAMIGLAGVAVMGGRTEEARRWIERARTAGAPNEALLLQEASVFRQSGQEDEALKLLRTVADKYPAYLEAWAMLADVLFSRGSLQEVEQRVLPAMAKAAAPADHVLVHLVRAQLLLRRQPADLASARIAYLRALQLRPDLLQVRNDLLQLDIRIGNPTCMEVDAAQVLRAEPDDALANYVLAAALLEQKEFARAEQHFRRSLAVRRSGLALNDLAELLRQQRRFEEAESLAREAIRLIPKFHQGWDTLAGVLADAGRAADAVAAAEQAIKLCDTDARLYVTLARARLVQGRPDEARAALREITTRFPSVPEGVKKDAAALEQKIAGKTP
jgi:tetratricopeptide (TPR) repeat protein